MRYLPTIDLWNRGISHAVRTGQLKLQRGQWIKCGSKNLSRFVDIKECGTIMAAHWQGTPQATRRRYLDLCEIAQSQSPARQELIRAVMSGSLDDLSATGWRELRKLSNKVEKGCAV